jgi:hypothetical protein
LGGEDDLKFDEPEKPYFVMIYNQHGSAMIMHEDDEGFSPAFYADEEDAVNAAEQNAMAQACGFEVFCLGEGEFFG